MLARYLTKRSSDIFIKCGGCKAIRAEHTLIDVDWTVAWLELVTKQILLNISLGHCPFSSECLANTGGYP